MRTLIYAINLTLDGCADHTKGMADQELHNYYINLLAEADTFLYGRRTYDLMVPFWPDMATKPDAGFMGDYARAFMAVPEVAVASRTLSDPGYTKARIIRGDLREEVLKLKNREGKAILTGGVDLPSQLITLGLVDEFIFVHQPLIVGEGRRLPAAATDISRLKLVDTRSFSSGSVALRYRVG